MNFERAPEFNREYKTFQKKWRTLPADLVRAQRVIELLCSDEQPAFRKNYFASKRATILHEADGREVIKMRFDCAALGNKSLLRLVLIWVKIDDEVMLLELYSKSDKSREDTARIQRYLS